MVIIEILAFFKSVRSCQSLLFSKAVFLRYTAFFESFWLFL